MDASCKGCFGGRDKPCFLTPWTRVDMCFVYKPWPRVHDPQTQFWPGYCIRWLASKSCLLSSVLVEIIGEEGVLSSSRWHRLRQVHHRRWWIVGLRLWSWNKGSLFSCPEVAIITKTQEGSPSSEQTQGTYALPTIFLAQEDVNREYICSFQKTEQIRVIFGRIV